MVEQTMDIHTMVSYSEIGRNELIVHAIYMSWGYLKHISSDLRTNIPAAHTG